MLVTIKLDNTTIGFLRLKTERHCVVVIIAMQNYKYNLLLTNITLKSFLRLYITLLFIIISYTLSASNNTIQLNKNVDFVSREVTVSEVFQTVKTQTGCSFAYDNLLDLSKRLTLPFSSAKLFDVLDFVLGDRDYTLSNNIIIIKGPGSKKPENSHDNEQTVLPNNPKVEVESEDTEIDFNVLDVTFIANDAATNLPVSDVAISIEGVDKSGFTNEQGVWLLRGLEYGTYKVRCFSTLYSSLTKEIKVDDNSKVFVFDLTSVTIESQGINQLSTKPILTSFHRKVSPQRFPLLALKTNLLLDATTSISLGVEFRLNNRLSLDVPTSFNLWTFSGNKKIKHFLVQPEIRWWMNEVYNRHFLGAHLLYSHYNIAGVKIPQFGGSVMKTNRYQGDLYGVGVSYGYHVMLSNKFSLEATFGLGYMYADYRRYRCMKCSDLIEKEQKHFFGPTKLGLSLIFMIK